MHGTGGTMERSEGAFPAGLEQPEGSFRFSADALLLGEYAASRPEGAGSLCDLGSGCGIVAFAALRKRAGLVAVGVEREPLLAGAAGRNAHRLGLADRYSSVCGDVCDADALARARESLGGLLGRPGEKALFGMVACNPPWKREEAGRVPPSAMRRKALFGGSDAFSAFFSAADTLLADRGVLAVLAGAECTAGLLSALPPRLHAEELRFFCRGQSARRVILLARKNGRADLRVEALPF